MDADSMSSRCFNLWCVDLQHEAVATSLCAIVPTGLAGTFHNVRRRAVNVRPPSILMLVFQHTAIEVASFTHADIKVASREAHYFIT